MIQISLLGAFGVHRPDGSAIEIEGRKGRALLALLASPPGRQRPREQVCGLLWGERGEDQARGSLRQLLASLRKSLRPQDDALVATRETIGLDASAVSTDVAAFEESARGGTADMLKTALGLYRGPFLADLDLAGADYEDWAAAERRRLHQSGRRICRRLLEQGEERADPRLIREAAARLIELEPGDEAGHRAIMRLHAAEDDVAGALRQYELCREILARDLAVRPSAETERLVDEIRQGRARSARAAASAPGPSGPEPVTGPRLAIIPFDITADTPAERRFADGLTQDLATELSRFRSLVVRTTASPGADFLFSGSIRRLDDRIRIAAQLVDASNGVLLWSEHYDRPEGALFAVLDELVATVAGTLVGRLEAACAAHARRKPPASLAAYECVLRGDALPVGDPAAEAEARALYEQAIRLDPGYARARAMLAYQLSIAWLNDLDGPDEPLDRALELARAAVAMDPCCSVSHGILGWVHLLRKSFDLAERHKRRALELLPNSVYETACMGVLHTFLGEADTALAYYARARALDPFYEPAWFWRMQGMAHFIARRYDEAVACLERTPTMPIWDLAYLAASHALAGRADEAAAFASQLTRRDPAFSASRFAAKEPLKRPSDREHLLQGLGKAALPG